MTDELQDNMPSESPQEPDMPQEADKDASSQQQSIEPSAPAASATEKEAGGEDEQQQSQLNLEKFAQNFSKEKLNKTIGGKRESPFEPITQDLREHIKAVFVPPPGYPQQITYSEQRIFIILGEENVGKLTAAIQLAMTLAQTATIGEGNIFMYRRTSAEDVRSLNDIINNNDFTEQSIYILPEAFTLGLRRSDLGRNSKGLYDEILRDKSVYFILTSSDTSIEGISHHDPIHIESPMIDAVLDKHLNINIPDHFPAYRLLVERQRSYILEHLVFPSQIYELFTRIRSTTPTSDEALQQIITSVAELERRNTRTWFDSLNFNEKLFGMLAAILQNRFDLTRYEMESLYTQLVNRLRQDVGLNHESAFIDARRIGLEDIADHVGLRLNAAGVLEFERRSVLENFLRQTENYHRLLWIATDVFAGIINGQEVSSFPRAIYALAIIIGQIGILRPDELKPLLDELADHQDARVSALAGEILRPIARRTQHHRFLIELLESWVTPRDSTNKIIDDMDRYWAAANTIAAIYDDVYTLTEESAFQDTRRSQETLSVARLTLDKLHGFLTTLCERVVKHEAQIRQLGETLQQSLPENIQAYAVSERLIAEGESLSKELYLELERAGKAAIREAQADFAIQLTEFSLSTLLQVLNDIYHKHPSQIIKLISSWLERSISRGQQDETEIEIERQLEAIRAQDKPQDIPQKQEQHRRELRKIDDAVLRIGFAAASYLFWQTVLSQGEQMPQNVRVAAQNPAPATQEAQPDNAPKEVAKDTPKDTPTKSLNRAQLEAEDASRDKNEATAPQGKENKRNTRIDLENRYYSLLALLPLLMESTNYDLDLLSFLKDIPFDTQVLQDRYNGDGQKFSDETVAMLTISPLAFAFFAMVSWYELVQNDAQGWVNQLYPSLLRLVNDSRQNSRVILRENLFRQGWIDSAHKDVRDIGRALIARSYVLDGVVMDLPSDTRYAAVLLDATRQVRQPRTGYFELSFELIQRLSLLTPLRVYFLGEVRRMHTMGALSQGNTLSQPRELRPIRARNRLLMPLIESSYEHNTPTFTSIKPAGLHYALLFVPISLLKPQTDTNQQEDVADLADLIEQAVTSISQEAPIETFDPFASKTEREQSQKQAQDGAWDLQNKFMLLTTQRDQLLEEMRQVIGGVYNKGKPLNIQIPPERLFDIVPLEDTSLNDGDIQRIEQHVYQQITQTLHTIPYEAWHSELSRYLPQLSPSAPLDVLPQIEQWVKQLDDIEKARHPGDVTLTIAWWVLMIAQYVDTSKAVSIVQTWMSQGERLQQHMGAAAARLLFNFYGILSPQGNIERFKALLPLIEPFIAMERGYSDFSPLLHIMLNWGLDAQWAQVLMEEESSFLAALRGIEDRPSMRRILDDVGYYEIVYGLLLLQYQLKLDLEDFRMLILEVLTWSITTPSVRQREQHELRFAQEKNLTVVQVRELKVLITSNGFLNNYADVMRNLRDLSQTISDEKLEDYRQAFANMQHLSDRVRLQFHNRLGNKIKPPTDGTQYGLIIVDVVNADVMVKTALLFVEQFQKKKTSHTLTMHRMGRRELVYHGTSGKPSMKNLKPEGAPQFASLLGPILDQYTPESVSFVLVLSNRAILDLEDWTDDPQWQKRLWVHGGYGTRIFGVDSSQASSKNKVAKLDVDELVDALLAKTD